jgi:general secretion pathway protein J
MTPVSAEGGFTLVELLVTLTLLAFLSVLLFGGLRFGSRAWESAQVAYTGGTATRMAQQTLSRDLSRAYPMPVADVGDSARWHVDFEGSASDLRWLTTGDRGLLQRLHLFAADGRIALTLGDELSQGSRIAILVDRASGLEIAYYGVRGAETVARWSDDWHGEARLPALVRIRAKLEGRRRRWPELVIAPRVEGDVGCEIDMLRHDCRGRS